MTSLFLNLLNVSITASWIVLAVILIRLLLRKSPKWISCLLWVIVALRLIVPVFPESTVSLIPSQELLPQQTLTEERPAVESGALTVGQPQITEQTTQPGKGETLLKVASVVWLAGVVGCLVYSLVAYWSLRRRVRVSVLQEKNVYASDAVDSPFILGIFRPRIYVPSGLEEPLLQCVLAHEYAHIRRRDHWWKPLGFGLLTIYWFNPVLWVAYILLCRDIEKACDEKAVANMDSREKLRYSQALILCSVPRKLVAACPVAFGEVAVKERIKGIVRYRKPAVWIVAVSVVVCAVVAVCFLTDPKTCIHDYAGQITVQSTCTHQGTECFTCTKCEDSYMKPIPLIAHSYDEGIVTQAADCIHTGTLERTCTDCGAKATETIAVTSHTAGQMTVTKASNCTEKGLASAICTVCNAAFDVELPPDSHTHNLEESIIRGATCSQAGIGMRKCSRCNFQEDCTYQTLSHSYRESVICPATCSQEGQKKLTCTACGEEHVTVIPKSAIHKWVDMGNNIPDQCSACGATKATGTFAKQQTSSSGGYDMSADMNKTGYTNEKTLPEKIWWDYDAYQRQKLLDLESPK